MQQNGTVTAQTPLTPTTQTLNGVSTTLGNYYQQLVEFVRSFDDDPILTTLVGSAASGVATAVALEGIRALTGYADL